MSLKSSIFHSKSKSLGIGIALCCLAGGGFIAGYFIGSPHLRTRKPVITQDALSAVADRVLPLKAGPWGNLEAIPIRIEPPQEYLPVKDLEEHGRNWNFVGYSSDMLWELLRKAGLTADQFAELTDMTKWQQSGAGITLEPSSELIFSLSQGSRKTIYTALWMIPASGLRGRMASFREDQFDKDFSKSGLSSDIIQWIKKLSFHHGRLLFFCDVPWVLEKIPAYDEKVRFLKAVVGKSTLLLRLHVLPDSDTNSLVNYWSRAAWGKDIKPMLESLARVDGGARVDIVHLLPPMPTACLYTFPFPSVNPIDRLKDCHWVALNFFRDPPDLSLIDHEKIKKILQDDYCPVISDPRYGDLVELVRPNGDVIHSAVYIADDVVYTKNSADPVEPFMLMRISDMIDTFEAFVPEDEQLRQVVVRNKYY